VTAIVSERGSEPLTGARKGEGKADCDTHIEASPVTASGRKRSNCSSARFLTGGKGGGERTCPMLLDQILPRRAPKKGGVEEAMGEEDSPLHQVQPGKKELPEREEGEGTLSSPRAHLHSSHLVETQELQSLRKRGKRNTLLSSKESNS